MSNPRRLVMAVTGAAVVAGLLLGGASGASAAPASAATGPAAASVSADTKLPLSALLTPAELPSLGTWGSYEVYSHDDRYLYATTRTETGFAAQSEVRKYRTEADAAYYSDTARWLKEAQNGSGQGGYDPVYYTKIATVDGVDVYRVDYYTWGYYIGDALLFEAHDGLYTYRVNLWLPDSDTASPDVTKAVAGIKSHLAAL